MNAQQSEEIRHAVLEIIASRFPTALAVPAIRRRVKDAALVDFDPTDDHVNVALHFLLGMGRVEKRHDDMGATEYWACTSAGRLAWERGGK